MRATSRKVARRLQTADMATVGLRIRDARRAAGLTQRQVAGGAVTAAYLSRIETGDRRPSPRVLARIADVCGVDALSLVADVDDEATEQELRAQVVARSAAAWLRQPADLARYGALLEAVASWEAAASAGGLS